MRKRTIAFNIFLVMLLGSGCHDLDLYDLDDPSSASWHQRKEEFRYSLNALYIGKTAGLTDALWSDNLIRRGQLSTPKTGGLQSTNGGIKNTWRDLYKGVARAVRIREELEEKGGILPEDLRAQYEAEVKYHLANTYTVLITRFGDVPFINKTLTIDESRTVSRTDKNTIKEQIFQWYDEAASALPVSYDGLQYATKGAAYAQKARAALYLEEWAVAKDAAKACIDLGKYSLHDDYADLFFSKTKHSPEIIISYPRSNELNRNFSTNWWIPRCVPSGYGGTNPTWDLLATYECIDGKMIDESPLFDPRNPFQDRDPRLKATIVPFGKQTASDQLTASSGVNFNGIDYNPHPQALWVMNHNTGQMIFNHDSRGRQTHAPYNALLKAKGIDEEWYDDLRSDQDQMIHRYAEVLLTYAEAQIELSNGDLGQARWAINLIRERAYRGTGIPFPEITSNDRDELRKILRNERRVELALEGQRYMDLIRWRLAEHAFNGYNLAPLYAIPNPSTDAKPEDIEGKLIDLIVNKGLWFWAETPTIDPQTGLPQFKDWEEGDEGSGKKSFARVLSTMKFDPNRHYLFPIPQAEIDLNENLTQNPEY
ncbi:starch-binding protein (plasmid) [Fulvitalea axinellae]|uniref:Starch-binding protein n=1 Tax=Fulvitalea axinellae TaxID=1182444 RepID=A0AAU9CRK0_9BACT|nr:starch-binding protein [Fulvitalea axinellae]